MNILSDTRKRTTTSVLLWYDPHPQFASGTLTVLDYDSGQTVSQSIIMQAGLLSITGLTAATRYSITVAPLDAASGTLPDSNTLVIETRLNDDSDSWVIWRWHGNSNRWTHRDVDTADVRVSLDVNQKDYWFQFGFECAEQNARIVMRGLKLHMRVGGRSEEARE